MLYSYQCSFNVSDTVFASNNITQDVDDETRDYLDAILESLVQKNGPWSSYGYSFGAGSSDDSGLLETHRGSSYIITNCTIVDNRAYAIVKMVDSVTRGQS